MPENLRLPDEELALGLALASQRLASDRRKLEAWRRYLFLKEDFGTLIAKRIAGTHSDTDTINEICSWIDESLNLPLDILREICVVWNKPVRRTVAGVTDEKNEALAKLYRETLGFDRIAQQLNKHAFFLGEVVVVPEVVNEQVRLTTLLPFFYDTIDDPDDPTGDPWAYVYTMRRPNEHLTRSGTTRDDLVLRHGDAVVLDRKSWRVFEQGTARQTNEIVHDLEFQPGAALRFHESLDGDRWSEFRANRRMYDAGIKVGVIDTQMSWVRKAQNRQLLAAVGNLPMEMDDKQTSHPERGFTIPTDSPADLLIQSLPFDTDPANFIRHIAFAYDASARSYGGMAQMSIGEGGALTANVEFPFEAQTEIREDQIPYARAFEKNLCKSIIGVLGAANHPLARELPTLEEVEEGFTVNFGRLSRTFASAGEEIEYFEFLEKRGLASASDLFDQHDPELTEEQRKEVIEANLEKTADAHDFAATRNLPMGSEGVETLPQIQGAMGPEMRDAMAEPQQDEDDEDDGGRQRKPKPGKPAA